MKSYCDVLGTPPLSLAKPDVLEALIAQTALSSDTAPWKDLTEQLPGVLSVEFVTEGSAVREVHVLSDQSRSPKQIVRDIQSALLARFQLELDHRIISVAQIPGLPTAMQRRLICARLELSAGRDGVDMAVSLRIGDVYHKGVARSDRSSAGRNRAIAQATTDAINQFLGDGCRFCLDELRQVPIGGQMAVLVWLRLEQAGKAESLLGACYLGEDPNFSVALATLDGVNRRILALTFTREEGCGS